MTTPIDMSKFIETKSDQIGADDLIGGPRTVIIRGVTANEGDQPVNIWLENEQRAFRPCKTMRRVMVAMWGADASQYVGRSMTLYRDASVTFGGMQVGGIRISHMSHIESARDIVVMKSKGKRAVMKILPLASANLAPAQVASGTVKSREGAVTFAADDSKLDKARGFVAELLHSVAIAADVTDLEMMLLASRTVNGLAKLEREYPDLWRSVQLAVDARRAEFAPASLRSTDFDADGLG
jgi:hypothetical protein